MDPAKMDAEVRAKINYIGCTAAILHCVCHVLDPIEQAAVRALSDSIWREVQGLERLMEAARAHPPKA